MADTEEQIVATEGNGDSEQQLSENIRQLADVAKEAINKQEKSSKNRGSRKSIPNDPFVEATRAIEQVYNEIANLPIAESSDTSSVTE